ncbi:acyl carrier protein 1, chloroplastic-like protein, partial [Tanacetum coccineum]
MEEVKRMRLTHGRQLEDVPELIHHIQALMLAKDAARTCVFSKSWLHAWSTIPTLSQSHLLVLKKFIKRVASKSSLKELCLTVVDEVASITLQDEIFSSENLVDTLSIKLDFSLHTVRLHTARPLTKNYPLRISSNPLIVCVNLRVLELHDVRIMEQVLHKLLSTCKLLEKINLRLPEGLNKISVKNLLHFMS